MRKTFIALGVFVALCVAYVVWPFASLFEVVRASQAGDTATISKRVDVPALRRSFTAQLIETYARLTGKNLDRKGVIGAVAGSITDPMVEKLLTSPIIAELIRTGWTKSVVVADRPPSFEGLDASALGNAWQLFVNSDYGVGQVRYAVPTSRPKEKQFRVRLALSQWNWKLAGLDLPHELQEQIVRELLKQERATEKLVGLRRGD